jgi:glycosyltransferase involved in cell wall biosynthesis
VRIGFIGNQNNYPFMLARGLRRRGHEVRVVIDQAHPLDRPEYRYADVSCPYPDWIREVAPVQMADVVFNTAHWRGVIDFVRDCDALVLNKFGYDAANRLSSPAFCLTTGGDVEFWSNPAAAEAFACATDGDARKTDWIGSAMRIPRLDWASLAQVLDQAPRPLHRAAYKQLFRLFVRRQRAGLARAVGINGLPDGVSPAMADVMRACRAPGVPRLHMLMADLSAITPTPAPANAVLRVFNAARILWQRPFPPLVGEWESKGTDVLLKGIALWHHRHGRAIDVRLVEKGRSIRATKDLVQDLNIQHLVSWRPELTQAEVFEEYKVADIVSEQCGSHVLGMAGYEAMAAGRPVIANGRPDLYDALPGGRRPVAQAATPEEVAHQLDRLADPAARARLALAGRRFVEQHLSVDAAARQVEAVLATAVNARRPTDPRSSA